MTLRHLFVQFTLFSAMLVIANVAVTVLARNSHPRQLLRKDAPPPATHLFFGNSTMAAGFKEHAFTQGYGDCRPLNLGIGSTLPVEHYLLFRSWSRRSGVVVCYGFFDLQLTEPPDGNWGALVGNRAMAYYVEPDVAVSFYARDSVVKAASMRLVGHVPMLVERLTVWAKVEQVRRRLGEIGFPQAAQNQFGRVNDFTQLELDEGTFRRQCVEAVELSRPLTEPVARMLRETISSGGRFTFVEMPMPAEHRSKYYDCPEWQSYRNYLRAMIAGSQGRYVAAADWIPDSGFSDPLHLNENGAKEFSKRLGRELKVD